jgi:hypothetical protein
MSITIDDQNDTKESNVKEYLKFKSFIEVNKKINVPDDFETILTTNDDKSALISMVLRNLNLWADETFWSESIDLEKVMNHYATDENASVKNLFSILTHDWCKPNDDYDDSYHLTLKFEKFDKSGKSLFQKLCEIANKHDFTGDVCARIIKIYLLELKDSENVQEKLVKCLQFTLTVKNRRVKFEMLKNLVQILKKDEESERHYDEIKRKVTEATRSSVTFDSHYKKSLTDMQLVHGEKFFSLVFLVCENSIDFEQRFDEFLTLSKDFFGHHWQHCVSADVKRLKFIAGNVLELDVEKFIANRCEFVKKKVDKFCSAFVVINEPQMKELNEHMVSFWGV